MELAENWRRNGERYLNVSAFIAENTTCISVIKMIHQKVVYIGLIWNPESNIDAVWSTLESVPQKSSR